MIMYLGYGSVTAHFDVPLEQFMDMDPQEFHDNYLLPALLALREQSIEAALNGAAQ